MVILWRLIFGHFLADFALQSNFINAWKRSSPWGMMAHCAIHPVCYVALTYSYIGDIWVSNPLFSLSGWTCVGILFAAHYIEDQWRVFMIFRYNFPDSTLFFLWDQFIHYIVIIAVIPMSLQGGSSFELIPEKWPVLGSLFLIATYFCTILIYFIEKDLYGKGFPSLVEKYIGMAERAVIFLCLSIPSAALGGLSAAGWIAWMCAARSRKWVKLSWFNCALGSLVSVLCGILGRVILYSY